MLLLKNLKQEYCVIYIFILQLAILKGRKDAGIYENLKKCIENETYLEKEYFLSIGRT